MHLALKYGFVRKSALIWLDGPVDKQFYVKLRARLESSNRNSWGKRTSAWGYRWCLLVA